MYVRKHLYNIWGETLDGLISSVIKKALNRDITNCCMLCLGFNMTFCCVSACVELCARVSYQVIHPVHNNDM